MTKSWIVFVLLGCLAAKASDHGRLARVKNSRISTSAVKSPASEGERKKIFFANPLTVNGLVLNQTYFSIHSRGKLAVVEGNPDVAGASRIPFRAYLKRGGMVIQTRLSDAGSAFEVELADVLQTARIGDELVIEPTRPEDAMARRIIKFRNFWFLPFLPDSSHC